MPVEEIGGSMRRVQKIIAVVLVGVVGGFLVAGPSSPEAAAGIGGLTWADEFDGPAGAAPDPGRWGRDIGGGGWGNNELQYYTNSTSNAALDGQGHLVLTARRENPANYGCWYGTCQYTSARLLTAGRFTQAYGRFEARLKVPRGQGIWPAFWMLGDNLGSVGWPSSGEIDIMENVGFEPNTVHGSLHGPGYSGGSPLTGTYSLPVPFADDFHTFTVDWAPDSVTFYVDGHQYARHTPADTRGNRWVFDHPFFMILNVAVGGNWPGSPDGSTVFPQQMVVDYVRVFAYTTGGGTRTGAITGIGGKCVDVYAADRTNGTQVQLYTCNGTNAQQWTIGNGNQIQALGKCLDVAGARTAPGTKVQLWDCNGTVAQQWVYSDGRLINPNSNRCLDAYGGRSDDWTPLIIWDCHGGANQRWNLPG
jgi:beta-glucanase (GH16 family)